MRRTRQKVAVAPTAGGDVRGWGLGCWGFVVWRLEVGGFDVGDFDGKKTKAANPKGTGVK